MPVKENGQWEYKDISSRHLDRDKVEEWKSIFYELEGWDSTTGRPLRSTLEEFGLHNVLEVLQEKTRY
jgi:aldehyde:ferredoxin oxidoreductase